MVDTAYYPKIEPYEQAMIKVSDLHSVYVRQAGSKDGLPVLVVHGGPGAGCSNEDFRFFDPDFYRIILVDQRGAGESIPFACMQDNNLQALIADFELIRKQLKIKNWLLFGGSWGSTLSLAYSQEHPEVCLGLILRGIWLARTQEIDFFFNNIGDCFPERAAEFYEYISQNERSNILQAYYRRLIDPDPKIHMPAAVMFAKYELGAAYHDPSPNLNRILSNDKLTLGLSRTECHYMVNKMFLNENQLLININKINHLYAELVHGRYDAICPYSGAYELKSKWPKAKLTTVNNGGHSATDPAIRSALVKACNRFRYHCLSNNLVT